jgi:hypothetical protein
MQNFAKLWYTTSTDCCSTYWYFRPRGNSNTHTVWQSPHFLFWQFHYIIFNAINERQSQIKEGSFIMQVLPLQYDGIFVPLELRKSSLHHKTHFTLLARIHYILHIMLDEVFIIKKKKVTKIYLAFSKLQIERPIIQLFS